MKRLLLTPIALLTSIFLLTGCIPLLLGGAVAGAIVVTKDAVQLQYETNFDRAWRATHSALDRMGIINAEDKKAGTIEATIQESHVSARITPVTASAMKIEIKARRNLLPNMDLANKVINDINNRLHSSL